MSNHVSAYYYKSNQLIQLHIAADSWRTDVELTSTEAQRLIIRLDEAIREASSDQMKQAVKVLYNHNLDKVPEVNPFRPEPIEPETIAVV